MIQRFSSDLGSLTTVNWKIFSFQFIRTDIDIWTRLQTWTVVSRMQRKRPHFYSSWWSGNHIYESFWDALMMWAEVIGKNSLFPGSAALTYVHYKCKKKGQSQKSFGSPLEVLWKSSTVVASVTYRRNHTLTFGLLAKNTSATDCVSVISSLEVIVSFLIIDWSWAESVMIAIYKIGCW